MTIEEKLNALPDSTPGEIFVKDKWRDYFEEERRRLRHAYINDVLFEALAQQVTAAFEAGRDYEEELAKKIANEVIEKIILDDLKTHPKTTLKSFAKRHGYIEEKEEEF